MQVKVLVIRQLPGQVEQVLSVIPLGVMVVVQVAVVLLEMLVDVQLVRLLAMVLVVLGLAFPGAGLLQVLAVESSVKLVL